MKVQKQQIDQLVRIQNDLQQQLLQSVSISLDKETNSSIINKQLEEQLNTQITINQHNQQAISLNKIKKQSFKKLLLEKQQEISTITNNLLLKDKELQEKTKIISIKNNQVQMKNYLIQEKDLLLEEKDQRINANEQIISDKDKFISLKEKQIKEKEQLLQDKNILFLEKDQQLEQH